MFQLTVNRSALVLFFSFALASVVSADTVHIYLLGGQSNAVGRGNEAEIPADSPLAGPQTDVSFWYRKTAVSATNNVLPESQIIELAPGSGHGTGGVVFPVEFGSELSIGRTLADTFPNQNVMIIKGAHGGTTLATGWADGGLHYNNFTQTVTDAIAAVVANGDTPVMMGMFWIQGESDSSATNSANYGMNLVDLVSRVRNDFFDGRIAPFVLSQFSDNQSNSLSMGNVLVREGQITTAANDASVGMVRTDEAAISVRADIIHFDANGQVNLGAAMGEEMARLVCGTETEFLPIENRKFDELAAGGNNTDTIPGWSVFGGTSANGFGTNTGSDGAPDAPSLFLGNDHGVFQVLSNSFEAGVEYQISLLVEQTGAPAVNGAIDISVYAEDSPGSAAGGNQLPLTGVSLAHTQVSEGLTLDNSFDLIETSFVADSTLAGKNIVVALSEGNQTAAFIGIDTIVVRATKFAIPGDLNCDGTVNLLDVEPFVTVLSNGDANPKADINKDGVSNLLDVGGFVQILTGG